MEQDNGFRLKIIFINFFLPLFVFLHNQVIMSMYDSFVDGGPLYRFTRLFNFVENQNLLIFTFIAAPLALFFGWYLSSVEEAVHDESVLERAKTRVMLFPKILLISYLVGFTLGPIISQVIQAIKGTPFQEFQNNTLLSIFSGLYAFSFALIICDSIIHPMQEKLGIIVCDEMKMSLSLNLKLLIAALSTAGLIYAVNNYISFFYFTVGDVVTGGHFWNITLNSLFIAGLAGIKLYILSNNNIKSMNSMRRTINNLISGKENLSKRIPIAAFDEMGQLLSDFNQFMDFLDKDVMVEIAGSVNILKESVLHVTSASQQIATTSNEQAAAVKEVVSTMEDAENVSKGIAGKIKGVADGANETKNAVGDGVSIVQANLMKMDQIKESNFKTIQAIKSLGEQIDSIWEIVTIINSVAAQTKIIAFNAELEASSAGEIGKNFEIVANEIRRLADNTVNSTRDIREKINDIQAFSNSLVEASESEALRVQEGWKLTNQTSEVFENIYSSTETSAQSAEHIATSIKQQTDSFRQIVETLKQISYGINSFVDSTKAMNQSSGELKDLADSLNAMVSRYIDTSEW